MKLTNLEKMPMTELMGVIVVTFSLVSLILVNTLNIISNDKLTGGIISSGSNTKLVDVKGGNVVQSGLIVTLVFSILGLIYELILHKFVKNEIICIFVGTGLSIAVLAGGATAIDSMRQIDVSVEDMGNSNYNVVKGMVYTTSSLAILCAILCIAQKTLKLVKKYK